MLRVPLAFFFCLKLFLHLSPPHQDKGGETACVCVCVCFVFLLKTSTAFFHHVSIQRVFVSCFQVTKKRACATGSTTLHFHALKIAGPGESSTSLYCFHALKTTMKTTKKYNTTYDIRFMIRIFCCQTSGH